MVTDAWRGATLKENNYMARVQSGPQKAQPFFRNDLTTPDLFGGGCDRARDDHAAASPGARASRFPARFPARDASRVVARQAAQATGR